jgi:outer membrane protein TolC
MNTTCLSLFAIVLVSLSGVSAAANLSTSEAFNKLSSKSSDVQRAQAVRDAAANASRDAVWSHLPSVGLFASTSQSSRETQGSQYGIESRWSLFSFGADRAAYHSAKAGLLAAEHGLKTAQFRGEELASTLVLDVVFYRREQALQIRSREIRQRLEQSAERLFKSGIKPKVELQRMSVQSGLEDERSSAVAQSLGSAERQLQGYLGDDSMTGQEWPWGSVNALIPAIVKKLQETSLASHPLRQQVEAKLEQAQASQREASATGSGISLAAQMFQSPENGGFKSSPDWNASVQFSFPLLGDRSRWAAERQADLAYVDSKIQRDETVRSIDVEARNGFDALQTAVKSITKTESVLKEATEIYTRSSELFQKGVIPSSEINDDLGNLLLAERAVNDAHNRMHRSLLNACHAAGLALTECVSLP